MDIEKLEEIFIFCEGYSRNDHALTSEKIKYFSESSGEPMEKIYKIYSMIIKAAKRKESLIEELEKKYENAKKTIEEKDKCIFLASNDLDSVSKELEALKNNEEKAYSNYKNLTDQLLSSRKKALQELEHIDVKLSAAGVSGTTESKSIFGTFIAIVSSIALAVLLIYLSYSIGGEKPTANIEISYDLGKMVEAFLLGSGALIAGVAYAFSIFKNKGKPL